MMGFGVWRGRDRYIVLLPDSGGGLVVEEGLVDGKGGFGLNRRHEQGIGIGRRRG